MAQPKRRIAMKKLLSVVLVLVVAGTATAQVSMDIVGRAEYGPAYVTYVDGNYLYVGAGDALLVFDVTQPDTMVFVSSTYFNSPLGGPHSFSRINDEYFIAALYDYGYGIVNVSDPAHPRVENIYQVENGRALWVYVSGNYAYLADAPRGLLIIDVSDPQNPSIVGSYNPEGDALVAGVFVVDTLAYVAAVDSGFRIVNVADPHNPVEVGSIVLSDEVVSLVVRDTLAYLANAHDGLTIINVADPTSPQLVGSVDTDGYTWDVTMLNDTIAVLADWSKGIKTVNVADATAPTILGSYDTPGTTWRVAVKGNYIYGADKRGGVPLCEMDSTGALTLISTYTTGNWIWGVGIGNNVIATGGNTVPTSIYDVSDPSNPTKIATLMENYRFVWDINISDTLMFLSANADGVPIYNIADPANPVLLAIADPTRAQYTLRDGNILYVAIGTHGVSTVDISDPTNPVTLYTFDTGSNAFRLELKDTLLFVADKSDGMVILNVANPDSITLVSILTMTSDDDAYGIAVHDTFAYIGNWDAGLFVASIADPANPYVIGSIPAQYRVRDTRYAGSDLVVTAEEDSGVCVYDVSDPTNIQFVTKMLLGDWAWEIKPMGNGLYAVAARGAGIYIIRITPVDVEEENAPSTRGVLLTSAVARDRINVKFYYPVERPATAQLYSVDGRLVKSIPFMAGPNTPQLSIPVADMASGIYILRISIGDRDITQKISVVR